MNVAPKIARKENGCWEWIGCLDAHGYGAIGFNGKTIKAHRFFYELFVGSLNHDLTIDHLCKNKRCVNPEHLEQVTLSINISRAAKTHCKRGHAFTEENTLMLERRGGERVCRECNKVACRKY